MCGVAIVIARRECSFAFGTRPSSVPHKLQNGGDARILSQTRYAFHIVCEYEERCGHSLKPISMPIVGRAERVQAGVEFEEIAAADVPEYVPHHDEDAPEHGGKFG